MAFFGAIIAGFITLTVCAWRYGLNPWLALGRRAAFAVVGQPIGRIGNLINGDILVPRAPPLATAYANPGRSSRRGFTSAPPASCIAYQPAAAYEALATIAIGVLLLLLCRRRVPLGVIAITYVAAYSITQLIVFELRASETGRAARLRQSAVDLDRHAASSASRLIPSLAVDEGTSGGWTRVEASAKRASGGELQPTASAIAS